MHWVTGESLWSLYDEMVIFNITFRCSKNAAYPQLLRGLLLLVEGLMLNTMNLLGYYNMHNFEENNIRAII